MTIFTHIFQGEGKSSKRFVSLETCRAGTGTIRYLDQMRWRPSRYHRI